MAETFDVRPQDKLGARDDDDASAPAPAPSRLEDANEWRALVTALGDSVSSTSNRSIPDQSRR
jgi:hypothetical protein